MRVAVALAAILAPGISPAQDSKWSLEVLERYASWVRDGGFLCSLPTRVTEVSPDDGGTAFKVTCGLDSMPLTGEEAAFRLT
jgi:hypothetical protein